MWRQVQLLRALLLVLLQTVLCLRVQCRTGSGPGRRLRLRLLR